MRGGEIRICTDCELPLPLKAFASIKKRYRRHKCIKCANVWDRYKITGKEFHAMLARQLYRCLICENPIDERTACVDHDHDDLAVRSLLCNACNTGIGLLRHNRDIVSRALEYLAKFT